MALHNESPSHFFCVFVLMSKAKSLLLHILMSKVTSLLYICECENELLISFSFSPTGIGQLLMVIPKTCM